MRGPTPHEHIDDIPAVPPAPQRGRWLSRAAGVILLAVIVAAAWDLAAPDRFHLRMVTPVGDHHARIARILAEEAETQGVHIAFVGSFAGDPLGALTSGAADLALVSGAPASRASLAEVALLQHETLHLLARAELAERGIAALAGQRINLGPQGVAWSAAAAALLSFAGIDPAAGIRPEQHDAGALMSLAPGDLPSAVLTAGGDCPPEAAYLVRHHGYRPVALPFTEALARLEPQLDAGELPPQVYSVRPPVPAESMPALTVGLRLVARHDASARAVRRVVATICDGAFVHRSSLPAPDEDRWSRDRALPLHAGTRAFLRRDDPWLTPDVVMETDAMRNMIMAAGLGVVLAVRWLKRRRNHAVVSAIARIHSLEREVLRLESDEKCTPGDAARLRRELTRVRAELVDHFAGRDRFEDPLVMDLIRHIDAMRHYLLAIAAHHHQMAGSDGESGTRSRGAAGAAVPVLLPARG